MADQINTRANRPTKVPRAFELDTLEQRILLSGETQVLGGTTPDQQALTLMMAVSSASPELDPLPPARLEEQRPDGSSSTLTVPADPAAVVTVGAGVTVSGAGDLDRSVVNGGNFSAGSAAGAAAGVGVVAVNDFTQLATGTLHLDIGGTEPARSGTGAGHDQILAEGVAQLAGKLELSLADDFVPTAGQAYDVIKWQSRSGSFTGVSGLYAGRGVFFVPEYRADGLRLTATQLPLIDGIVLADIEAGVRAVDSWLDAVVQRKAIENVALSAQFQIGGMTVAGDWTISVTSAGATTLRLANGAIQLTAGGLSGGVTGVSGTLAFGGGTATAINLSGLGSVAAFGGPVVAGQFGVSYDAATAATVIRAANVTAALGDARRGGAVEVTGGAMTLTLAAGRAMALDVSGLGRFAGLAGASFSGALRLVADSASGETRFVAQGAQVAIAGLASLSGNFAFAAQRTATETEVRQTFLIAAENAAGSVTLGDLSAQVSDAALAFALDTVSPLDGIGQYRTQSAVQGRANVSITVDDKLALTGQNVSIVFNNGTSAVAAQIVGASGQTVWLSVPASAASISGRITASIAGFGSFEGDLSFAITTASRLLSDATRVRVTEYALSGIGLSASLGGASGVRIDNGQGALVYAREVDGTRGWVTGKGTMEQAAVGTLLLSAGEGDGWSVNRSLSGLTAPTIDWTEARSFALADGSQVRLDQVNSTFAVAATGSFAVAGGALSGRVAATYDAAAASWSLAFDDMMFGLSAGQAVLQLSGGRGIITVDRDGKRSGRMSGALSVTGIDGLSADLTGSVDFGALDAALSVSAQGVIGLDGFARVEGNFVIRKEISVDGPQLVVAASGAQLRVGGTAEPALTLANADLGLVMLQGASGVALTATGGVSLSAAGLQLSATTASVQINHTGLAFSRSIALAGGRTLALDFAQPDDVATVTISGAELSLGGGAKVTGNLSVMPVVVTEGAIERRELRIGFSGASASGLALGGVAANLADVSGAVILFNDGAGQPQRVVQLAGAAALTGLQGVTLAARDMVYTQNSTGARITAQVETGNGAILVDLLPGVRRLGGVATIGVDGVFEATGSLFIESRAAQSVALNNADGSDAGTATVDMLLIGGSGLDLRLLAGDSPVIVSGADLGVILSRETGAGTRSWLTASAQATGIDLDILARAELNGALVEVNRALTATGSLAAADRPVLDLSGAGGRMLALAGDEAVVFDLDAPVFRTAVNGVLSLGGAELSGAMSLSEQLDADGNAYWSLTVTNGFLRMAAGGAEARISSVTGQYAITAAGISGTMQGVGSLTGVNGLTVTGALAASFAPDGRLRLAGDIDLSVVGLGGLAGQFAIERQPALVATSPDVVQRAATGGRATVTEVAKGGQSSNSVITLRVSGADGMTREGSYVLQYGGARTQVSTLLADRPISDEDLAAAIQTALEGLATIGRGNVLVAGTRADGFTLTFTGTLAGQPVLVATSADGAGLWMEQPADLPDAADWLVTERTATARQAVNEQQSLTIARTVPGTGLDTFTLTLGTKTTDAIALLPDGAKVTQRMLVSVTVNPNDRSNSFWFEANGKVSAAIGTGKGPVATQSFMQSAMEYLYGAGNVRVTYETGFVGNNRIDYYVELTGDLAGRNVTPPVAKTSRTSVVVAVSTLRAGSAGYSVQRQAQLIQEALEKTFGSNAATVTFRSGSAISNATFDIAFGGALRGVDLPQALARTTVAGVTLGLATQKDGSARSGEMQTLSLPTGLAKTAYQVTVTYRGVDYTTAAIATDATAAQVRAALLKAADAEGNDLVTLGADITVRAVAGGLTLDFGGTMAGRALDGMVARVLKSAPQPDAVLQQTAIGATSSETQHIDLRGAGLLRLGVQGGAGLTGVLDAATLTAASLQTALEAADPALAGNLEVLATGTAGVFAIRFVGGFEGQDVATLFSVPVQRLSLGMPQGERPTELALAIGTASAGKVLSIAGLDDAQIAALIRNELAAQTGVLAEDIMVSPVAAQALTFDIAFVGGVAGLDFATVSAVTSVTRMVSVARLLIGASDVTASAGTGAAAFSLQNGGLALVVQEGASGATGFALEASGSFGLALADGAVSLSATGTYRQNTLGSAVNLTVQTGLDRTAALVFADGTAVQDLTIASGTIGLAGLGSITGAARIIRTESMVNGQTVVDLSIGLDGVQGNLVLGGATVSLNDGRGAVVLRQTVTATGQVTTQQALQITGGMSITGLEPVSLTAENLTLRYNRWGAALERMVETPLSALRLSLADQETRISGTAGVTVDGILTAQGEIEIEARKAQSVTLSDGSMVAVDQIILTGKDIAAALTAVAVDGQPLLSFDDLDLGLVVATETGSATPRRWLTAKADIAGLDIAGNELVGGSSSVLDLNLALTGSSTATFAGTTSSGSGSGAGTGSGSGSSTGSGSGAGTGTGAGTGSSTGSGSGTGTGTGTGSGAGTGSSTGTGTGSGGGFAIGAPSLPVIDWSKLKLDLSGAEGTALELAAATGLSEVTVTGGIELGGAVLSGRITLSLDQSGATPVWVLRADGAELGFGVGGAFVGMTDVTGTLTFGGGQAARGSLSGTVIVDGLAGLSLSGQMSASYDGAGNLSFAGTGMQAAFGDLAAISGDFTFARAASGDLEISVSNVASMVGTTGTNISLSNGTLALLVSKKSEGVSGYALAGAARAVLNGVPGLTLNADAAIRINTLDRMLDTTIGGQRLAFGTTDRVSAVAITNAQLAIDGLGTVSGDLAIARRSGVDAAGVAFSETTIGLRNAAGALSLGAVGASLSGGSGAVVIRQSGSALATYGVQMAGSVAVTGVDAVELSATDMTIRYNSGAALSGVLVDLGNGTKQSVSLLANEQRLSGMATVRLADTVLTGEVFVTTRAGVSRTEAGGGAVTVDETVIGGKGLVATIAGGGATIATLREADIAMIVSSEQGGSGRKWLAMAGTVGEVTVAGQDIARISDAQLTVNRALSGGAVLDYSGQPALVTLSATDGAVARLDAAGERFALAMTAAVDFGAARMSGRFDLLRQGDARFDLVARDVDVTLTAGGVSVGLTGGTGTLSLAQGARSGSVSGAVALRGLTGLAVSGNLSASFDANGLSLAGRDVTVAVDGFAAMTGDFAVEKTAAGLVIGLSDVDATLSGLTMASGSMILSIARNAAGVDGFALSATGRAALAVPGLSLSADAAVAVNTLGQPVQAAITVNGQPLAIDFADGADRRAVTIRDGLLQVDGLGEIRADLAILSERTALADGFAERLVIDLGRASSDIGLSGLAAQLAAGAGVLVVERKLDLSGAVISSGYALQAEGDFAVSAGSALSLTAEKMRLSYNTLGRALRDEVVTVNGVTRVLAMAAGEQRLSGIVAVAVGDMLSANGQMVIENRAGLAARNLLLTDGTSVTVEQTVIAGRGLSLLAGSGDLALRVEDGDLALVLNREVSTGRTWLSAVSSVQAASVGGYGLAGISDAALAVNVALVAGRPQLTGTLPVIDWNGADNTGSTDVVTLNGSAIALSSGARELRLAATAGLDLGNAVLSGRFTVDLLNGPNGETAWHITAADASVGLSAGGAAVGITQASGDLFIGYDNGTFGKDRRSGQIIGDAAITGVDGLTAQGRIAAAFDATGNLSIAGAVTLEIAGSASLSGNFAFEKSAQTQVPPLTEAGVVQAGSAAQSVESLRGGQQTATTYALTVGELSGGGAFRLRGGAYAFAYSGTTATVTLTADLTDAVMKARLDAALETLLGLGNVTIGGDRQSGFAITLSGNLIGRDIDGLTVTPPADLSLSDDWGGTRVLQRATATSGSVQVTDRMPEGAEGSIAFEFDMTTARNAVFTLSMGGAGSYREGAYVFGFGAKSVTLLSQDRAGAVLSDSAWRTTLQSGLNGLFGSGNVTVSGTRAAGYTIALSGSLARTPVVLAQTLGGDGFFMGQPQDAGALMASRDTSVQTQAAVAQSVATSYLLTIDARAGASRNSDYFTLSFGDAGRGVSVVVNSIQDAQPRQIYDALKGLLGITKDGSKTFPTGVMARYGSSELVVTALNSPSNNAQFLIEFKGTAATRVLNLGAMSVAKDNPAAAVDYSLAAQGGAASVARGAVHVLSAIPAGAKGSYTLSIPYGTSTLVTGAIRFDASAADLRAAILAAGASGATLADQGVDVTVMTTAEGGFSLSFGGAAVGVPVGSIARSFAVTAAPQAGLALTVAGQAAVTVDYRTPEMDFADFNLSADVLRDALLAARSDQGTTLAQAGVSVDVTWRADLGRWQISFGGAAVGQDVSVLRGWVSPLAAPASGLAKTVAGATTDEVQRLDLAGQSGMVRLSFAGGLTAALAADSTATAVQAALAALPGVGAGNVTVSEDEAGQFVIRFGGALAGRDVATIGVVPVQRLGLAMTDGEIADVVTLSLGAGKSETIDLSGIADADARRDVLVSRVERAIARLSGVGIGNAALVAVAGQAGQYDLILSGPSALSQPVIGLTLGRALAQPEVFIKIGASDVVASVGGAQAGLRLTDGALALVISRQTEGGVGVVAPQPGYALSVAGKLALGGASLPIGLAADAELFINTLGRAVDVSVRTGLDASATRGVTFADGTLRRELVVNDGTVTVEGIGTISGGFKLVTTETRDGAATVSRVEIGIDSASAALTPAGIGATLSNGRGAVVIETRTVGGVSTTRHAFVAEGKLATQNVPGLSITADRLLVTMNRWQSDLALSVATVDGTFTAALSNGETRLRGTMDLSVGGVLTASGDLYIESAQNQTVRLVDGTSVQVDQLRIGGAGLAASLGAGAARADLRDATLGLILSTERVASGAARRWVSALADVESLKMQAGLDLQVSSAALQINRQIAATGGILANTGTVIDWNGASDTGSTVLSVATGKSVTLAYGEQALALGLTGQLTIGTAQVAGKFTLSLSETAGKQVWTVTVTDGRVRVAAGGAEVAIANVTGQVSIDQTGAKTGSFTGDGAITGVPGLAFQGRLSTRFDAAGNMQVAGSAALSLTDYAAISGDFAITKIVAPQVEPVVTTVRAAESNGATITQSVLGGLTTPTVFRLSAAGTAKDGSALFREGAYQFSFAGSRVTASTLAADGSKLSDAGVLENLQAALSLLFGTGNAEVTGSRAAGFALRLVGSLNGRDVTGLTLTPPADPADKTDWGTTSELRAATAGSAAAHYLRLQPVSIGQISGAKFTLTLADGRSTADIRYVADPDRQAAAIQAALADLVGAARVSVSFDQASPGITWQGYRITLQGGEALSAAQPFTTALNGSTLDGVVRVTASLTTLGQARDATGSVQQIDLYDEGIKGAFTLQFEALGRSFLTGPIAFDASAATLSAALKSAQTVSGTRFAALGGDALVELVDATGGSKLWQVTFAGSMVGQQMPVIQGRIVDLQRAPEASLVKQQAGATTSAVQRLVLSAATGPVALSFGGAITAPIAPDATARQIEAALAALSVIGAGNIRVTAVDGGFDIAFVGKFTNSWVAPLRVNEVQTIDLRLPDGLADVLRLRVAGGTVWQSEQTISGLSADSLRQVLAEGIRALKDGNGASAYGDAGLQVYATATPGVFQLVAAGSLIGADPVALVAGLSRSIPPMPDYLLIGATNVNATVGQATAGVSITGASLGLVISQNRDASGALSGSTYALDVTGNVALRGFGGAVSLTAAGSLRINHLGRSIDLSVPAGLNGTARQVTFGDALDRVELVVRDANLTVANFGTITANVALNLVQREVDGINTTDIRIGLSEARGSISQFGGLAATLANGRGAILLRQKEDLPSAYAVQIEGDIGFNAGNAARITATDLKFALNRWGSDVLEGVPTGTGIYEVDLVKDETRLRGHMAVTVDQALSVEGDLFIELRAGRQMRLTDGSLVTVDQLVIGGDNLTGRILPGQSFGVAIDGTRLLAVIATEVVAAGREARRWLSSVAGVGRAGFAGIDLVDVADAALALNTQLNGTRGTVPVNGGTALNWSGAPLSVTVATGTDAMVLNTAARTIRIAANAALAIGPARLEGDFTLTRDDVAKAWRITATGAELALQFGDVAARMTAANGTLVIGDDGKRSGSLLGNVALEGLTGVDLTGRMEASFDASGSMVITGSAALEIAGVAEFSGKLMVSRQVVGSRAMLTVAAVDVTSSIDLPAGSSALLRDGQFLLVAGTDAQGKSGYAIQGNATARVETPVFGLTGTINFAGNLLGLSLSSAVQMVDGTGATRSLSLASAGAVTKPAFDMGDLDVLLTGVLGDATEAVATTITDIKTAILPERSTGENTNTNPLALTLPVLDMSVSELVQADVILGIGDYAARYMAGPGGMPDSELPVPAYGTAGAPSLRGLLTYLQQNWLPTLGLKPEALQLVSDSSGVKLRFDGTVKIARSVTLAIDKAIAAGLEDIPLTLDGQVTLGINGSVSTAFDIAFDWTTGASSFLLDRLTYDLAAEAAGIVVGASFGPLAASIGKRGAETGLIRFTLAGKVVQTANGLRNELTRNSLDMSLPVYAQIGSLDLASGRLPRLTATGAPATAANGTGGGLSVDFH